MPAEDLLSMDGMDKDTAKLLAAKSIITMEDLAELATDELIELVKMDEERAKDINYDCSRTMVCLNNLLFYCD